MTDPKLIIESYSQLIAGWQWVPRACPEGEIIETDGLYVVWGNTSILLYNAIFVSQPVANEAELEAKIKAACHYASQRDRSWLLIICDDYLPEPVRSRAAEIFSRQQLVPYTHITGMVADELLPPVRPLPPELKCVGIDNMEKIRLFRSFYAIYTTIVAKSYVCSLLPAFPSPHSCQQEVFFA